VGFSREWFTRLKETSGYSLHPCIYDPEDQQKLIREAVDEILATNAHAEPDYWDRNRGYTDPERPRTFIVLRHAGDDFAHRLAEIAPRIKHESFKDEKEWRLVSRAISVWDLEHRSGESMIIPYYSIPIDYEGQLEPISEIVVGPTPHTELSKESVHSLALASGMIKTDGSGITISTTRIPFRNW